MSFKTVSHVIFDLDGLILDSETIISQVLQTIIDSYGKTLPWEIRIRLMGLTGRDMVAQLVDLLKLPLSYEECYSLYQKRSEHLLPSSELKEGAEWLIRHLHSVKVPIAVATSSSSRSFELKTQKHKELFSLFNHVVCGGSDPEVKKGKPSPDIFLICASRFPDKPNSEDCLVFEDSLNGVTAARNAGMQCIMVPDPNLNVTNQEATLVLKSLKDFKPELFGLPHIS